MKETDAVLLDWELVRNPRCEGWKTGAVGEFKLEALPSQGAQRRLPWGSDL